MATSGLFSNNPEIADLLREAFERAQIKTTDPDWTRIESAIRSANFVMQDFAARGAKQYQMQLVTQTTQTGNPTYTIDPGAYLFTAGLRRNGADTPILPISRSDYEEIPNKAVSGRPSEIWLDGGTYGVAPRTYKVWPVPENTSDIIRLWVLRRPETITSNLTQTAPISYEFQDAFCDALALRIAKKFNPSIAQALTGDAERSFLLAHALERDRAPVRFRVSTRGRRGWR